MALASSSDGPSDDLEKQIADLAKRVAALEAQVQTLRSSGAGASAGLEQEAAKALQSASQLVAAGKIDEAREVAFGLSRLVKAMPHPENTEFAAEEKTVLELLGICKRHVHPPFLPCTEAEVEQARRALEEYGILPVTAGVT